MTIRVHDTLQRKKIELQPLEPGHVRLYACGPTTYNFIHLGNARPIVVFDVVARHLRARGYKVTYVRNITDVDDKIIKRANELGESFESLTKRFTDILHEDVAALSCIEPDVEPRVSGHMPEIITLIEKLIARGVAYQSEGDVYFAVQQFPPYGELSHQPLDDLKAGARVDVGEKKRDPLDFALWKAAKPGEPSWDSPWGKGRPGWHIECSAMSWRHLGDTFDLHGGGIDLAFPHHENERAQSQGALGEGTCARAWLHNGFINFGGSKIAKSDASMKVLMDRAFRLRVLIEKHGGEAVRLFILTTQYRNPINFDIVVGEASEASRGASREAVPSGMPASIEGEDQANAPLRFPGLEEAERRLEYGYLTKRRLADALAVGKPGGEGAVAKEAEDWLGRAQEALDDDFNTPIALAALEEALGLANRILDGKLDAPKDVKRRTLERLQKDLQIASTELGVLEADANAWLAAHRARRCSAKKIDAAAVEQTIAQRTEARKAKDFQRADQIRDELKGMGVEIMDTPSGTTWRVTD